MSMRFPMRFPVRFPMHVPMHAASLAAALAAAPAEAASGEIVRTDFKVPSAPGIENAVREVHSARTDPARTPVVLLHGGGAGGVPTFDLEVPGYSLAAEVAAAGHPVYLMDVRGFGASTVPPDLADTRAGAAPAVPSEHVMQDLDAVVRALRERTGASQAAILGFASGGHWAAMYATRHPDAVSRLVMLNAIYGVAAPWGLAKAFADPDHPDRFNARPGAARVADAAGLLAGWSQGIPSADKAAWRDPRVAEAYVRQTLAGRATIRIPRAFQAEHFALTRGEKLWDARDIRVPVLVVRGGNDHWSRPQDLAALEAELVNAPAARFVEIPEATHFVFLDRPERGRARFVAELLAFLGGE